jgi:FkbH-like protein
MSLQIYSCLEWLQRPPESFRTDCAALLKSGPDLGVDARRLANYRLDGNQLNRLGGLLRKAITGGHDLRPLSSFRLGVLGTGTLDLIVPALVASAARHGLALDCIVGEYDQALQQAISPASELYSKKLDAVLLGIDYRSLPLKAVIGSRDAAEDMVAQCAELIRTMVSAITANSGALCILQTIPKPPERLFGSLDRSLPGTLTSMINALNMRIVDIVDGTENILLDVEGLADLVGQSEWYSPAEWNLAKFPFSNAYVPLYADHVARLIGSLRGKARKCLILDLDNTVWGGVIGDDGLEGIKIAQGDATGEAHLELQRTALSLRDRGVVLAVSSKNSDDVARKPFKEHPEMLLKEAHISVFQANWDDKATNIRAIAAELNLGLDAMVFVDDNPFERDLVRRMLPEVAVPELPEDPALYARVLSAAGYFEAISFSDEDLNRSKSYEDNARRVVLQQQTGNLAEYLRSLDMKITFSAFDAVGRARISQLINKSNQFNLTTRRYTEAQVADLERDQGTFTLQVRLEDKFGDNGMISVVICKSSQPATWDIDTWLMSCRVLGRQVENMVLRELILQARRLCVSRLTGAWYPTEKNSIVREHFANLGFTKTAEREDGATFWEIGTDHAPEPVPMIVIRTGLAFPEF